MLLGGSTASPLNFGFSSIFSVNLNLGVGQGLTQTLSGTITPRGDTYRLGGGGGTLVLTSNLVNSTNARSLVIGQPLAQSNGVDVPESSTPATSRVVLNGFNTFTGGTTVNSGILELGNPNALGTGSIQLNSNGTLVPSLAADQGLLDRITNTSVGSLALGADSPNNLNFSNAGQTMLGASVSATYSGTLIPADSIYRFGGGGGTLTVNSALSPFAATQLIVSGNGLPSTTVVLSNIDNLPAVLKVNDAKLTLGASGSTISGTTLAVTGATTFDLGGRTNLQLSGLSFAANGLGVINSKFSNGALTLFNSPTPLSSASTSTAQCAIDFSGLSKLSISSLGQSAALVLMNGQNSSLKLANDNAIFANTLVMGAGAATASYGQVHATIDLGHTNLIQAGTIDIGTQGGAVPQTLVRFPVGDTTAGLKMSGATAGQPVTNVIVRSGTFSDTTVDLTGGTTSMLANSFFVGRHGYTLGTKTTVRLGGANSMLNLGQMYIGYSQPIFDLGALPGNVSVSGVADDLFEQQAGTVLTSSLYFSTRTATTGSVPGDTLRSNYTLGTPTSSAVLSPHLIGIGGINQNATLTAKSRAAINFVNGRIETFNPLLATNGQTPNSSVPISDRTTIVRGLPGGGAANDYRTLMINVAQAGTHTFAAGAGKTLQVQSTSLITGPGGPTVEGPGTVEFDGANNYAGQTTINSGTLALASPAQDAIYTGGGADIRGGRLLFVLNSGSTNFTQLPTILAAGYAHNFADGPIRSSTATAARGLGYSTDSFGNVTVAAALYGDANLNGTVDFNDFLALQNSFTTTAAGWQGGDFNYDGVTDFNDFLALQNNFGQSISGAATLVTASQVSAMRAFAESVPEPVSGLVGVAAMFGLGRRRQRRVG